jgi:membrane complex biogenesis BtpA family protein
VEEVLERALGDARTLEAGGVDGLIVENFGDTPFLPGPVPPETVAAMTRVAGEVVQSCGVPVGVNVLRNDAVAALAVALCTGARFVRVNVHTGSMFTDQGLLEGRAHETLRRRASLGARVSILADVLVKHGAPPPGVTLEGAARDTWQRGRADGLIVTGAETGSPVDPEAVRRLRRNLPPEAKIWVGSGATPQTARDLAEASDGLIVGSALQRGGRAGGGVEAARVREFMEGLGRPEGPTSG